MYFVRRKKIEGGRTQGNVTNRKENMNERRIFSDSLLLLSVKTYDNTKVFNL